MLDQSAVHGAVKQTFPYRLSSVYAIVVAFYSTLFKFFEFGPSSTAVSATANCAEYWWKNLAYLTNQNLVENPGMVR